MKLTDTALRRIKETGKAQKVADGGGLYLFVSPSGGKLWRVDYRYEGKRQTISLGAYPAVSLKEARTRREEIKEQLAAGINPSACKKAIQRAQAGAVAAGFELIAREWFEHNRSAWVPSHADKIIARFERDLFPLLGKTPIDSLTAPQLLEALRRIEARGAHDTAHRALQNCGQVFRYAIATGRAAHNIAADLRGALVPVKAGAFASIKTPHAIGQLLRDIDAYTGNLIVRAALRIAPYVFVRPRELRYAEWGEFDLKAHEWRIPADRMKMKEVHLVPLAEQVVAILADLHHYTGTGRYLFPSMRAASAPISDMTLLAALRRLGYGKEAMTIHGFRSMASTCLNEQGYNRDWIERQLAHSERDSVRAAYNYAQHLPERRRMMQEWADYLDALRAGV